MYKNLKSKSVNPPKNKIQKETRSDEWLIFDKTFPIKKH